MVWTNKRNKQKETPYPVHLATITSVPSSWTARSFHKFPHILSLSPPWRRSCYSVTERNKLELLSGQLRVSPGWVDCTSSEWLPTEDTQIFRRPPSDSLIVVGDGCDHGQGAMSRNFFLLLLVGEMTSSVNRRQLLVGNGPYRKESGVKCCY